MGKNALILLIQETNDGGFLRQILANCGGFRAKSVDRVATALARIAGGGVDLAILDISESRRSEFQNLDSFLELRSGAPELPTIVISEPGEDGLILRAAKVGGVDHLTRAQCAAELGALIGAVIGKRPVASSARPYIVPESRNPGFLATFLGVKGGVGATTVSLNVACALAQRGRVVLAELRPGYGTMSLYFRPVRLNGDSALLLRAEAGMSDRIDPENVLWPCDDVPDLSVLFAPQDIKDCFEPPADAVSRVVEALSKISNYVVADLAPSLSDANRAVIESSDSLLLVVERDPLCVEAARRVLDVIHKWRIEATHLGSVIVNRTAYAVPMDLSQIEMQLAIPTIAVVPPASDLCVAAQKAHMPLASVDPESAVTAAMADVAAMLASRRRKLIRA